MLNTLGDAAAAATPFRTVRRLNLVFDSSPILRPPLSEPLSPRPTFRRIRLHVQHGHARATNLRRLINCEDNTMETTTSTIANMPAAAAVVSNLYRSEIYIA